MKDILIVVKPRRDSCPEPYNTLKTEALKYKESVIEVLETAFYITGPKSFEIAISLIRTCFEQNIQIALFEIEKCLYDPSSKA